MTGPTNKKKPTKKAAKKKPAKKRLTFKQETFIEHYISNGGNGVQAARDSGYKGSDSTLRALASRNTAKHNISEKIQERISGLKASSDEVLNLLADHLRADFADFHGCFDSEGRLDLAKAKQRGVSRLVKRIRTNTIIRFKKDGTSERETVTQLDLHDSQGAAKLLVDIMGLKQMPKENDSDVERKRSITELIAKIYGTEEENGDS